MATKQQIIDTIQQGIERVEKTYGPLTDEQLDTPVHVGDTGWTARQVLAHLAGRNETYEMLFQMANAQAQPPGGGFDIDHWNQQHVDARASKSKEELLDEFGAVHQRLIERVQALPEDELQRTASLPQGEMAVGDVLLGSGGMHSLRHAEEVEHGLGLPEQA